MSLDDFTDELPSRCDLGLQFCKVNMILNNSKQISRETQNMEHLFSLPFYRVHVTQLVKKTVLARHLGVTVVTKR